MNKKTTFLNSDIVIEQRENGKQPIIFVKDRSQRIYMIGITPDHDFDITFEGFNGDRYFMDIGKVTWVGKE